MKARKIGAWIVRILGIIIGLLIVTLVVVGFISVPQDEVLSPDEYGAGASSVQPSITGLHREFPALNEPEDNLTSPEKVELGRMLFFDPVLSSGNDMACASCHHPDKGFSDGLPQAIGSGDKSLKRNSLSLWNVGYAESLFWDGRESTLEEQALEPLTHADEMGVSDTRELEIELLGIPEYVVLFNAAFGGAEESVNVENVLKAIAAFERSLITTNSPFDRYAAGDLNALTPAQRRGLTLFRSAATRCFECHSTPTFATNTFRVTGAPEAPGLDHDPGRAGAADNGADGAFKVPSLRNVVLSAPYMHNGVFATLEEVIDFYAEGGGRAHGVENMDVFVQGFELNDQERADLVAFLYALTDESNLPEIPTTLPSGLTPVASQENPARDLALMYNVPSSGETATMGKPKTITVQAGETIQDAVDQARTGDTVLIPYGIYHERVVVDLNQITIHG
ncbi:MAG: hypothetical protein OEZ02_12265, partial [Anaerolineae bacterium]|nr:hypothetical protein [Anaerolineae bacterium]